MIEPLGRTDSYIREGEVSHRVGGDGGGHWGVGPVREGGVYEEPSQPKADTY